MFIEILNSPPSWILLVTGAIVSASVALFFWRENFKLKKMHANRDKLTVTESIQLAIKELQTAISAMNGEVSNMVKINTDNFNQIRSRSNENINSVVCTQEMVRELGVRIEQSLVDLREILENVEK